MSKLKCPEWRGPRFGKLVSSPVSSSTC